MRGVGHAAPRERKRAPQTAPAFSLLAPLQQLGHPVLDQGSCVRSDRVGFFSVIAVRLGQVRKDIVRLVVMGRYQIPDFVISKADKPVVLCIHLVATALYPTPEGASQTTSCVSFPQRSRPPETSIAQMCWSPEFTAM
jgi:hypothetical protein